MSGAENKAVVRRLYEEVFEGGRLDVADALVAPDRGPDRCKEVAAMLKAAFPDAHWEILDVIAEGDQVAMHAEWSGTHEGPFMGMPPTGRSFSGVHHSYWFRLRDGLVTEYRAVRDDAAMMRQLTAV
jgi:predicted ester cyclase